LDVDKAFEKARSEMKSDDLLLVTGSIYTAGEVYAYLALDKS
jgi:folylpolyglutamate synthase/dihydropteroate synthase